MLVKPSKCQTITRHCFPGKCINHVVRRRVASVLRREQTVLNLYAGCVASSAGRVAGDRALPGRRRLLLSLLPLASLTGLDNA
ncbi:MAG: hypothetical protein QOF58_7958 [Pseudonocardiales bacterium]|nr:hypothetical protein [Pseudonocardiales bacterium]